MKFPFACNGCLSLASFSEPTYRSLASAKILPIGFIMMKLMKLSVHATTNGYLFSTA